MNKLILIIYTLITSALYTFLVAYFAHDANGLALGYIAIILIAATGLIALGRDKISSLDHVKENAGKDQIIQDLKKSLKQTQAMLHSVKARVINVAINISDKDEFLETMKEVATMLNESPIINNFDMNDGVDLTGYLDVLKANAHSKV